MAQLPGDPGVEVESIPLARGFSYPTVFARSFKAQFGETPRAFRNIWRRKQSQAFRPEIRRLGFVGRETVGS